MRINIFLAIVLMFLGGMISCRRETETTSKIIYCNSFESADDVKGWNGISKSMLKDDPAPGGGSKSLHIFGGCIQPAAYVELPSASSDGHYKIRCWGKIQKQSQKGEVVLVKSDEERKSVHLTIGEEDWKLYETDELLFFKRDEKIQIEIWIGGFIGADMYVDCIEVERVK